MRYVEKVFYNYEEFMVYYEKYEPEGWRTKTTEHLLKENGFIVVVSDGTWCSCNLSDGLVNGLCRGCSKMRNRNKKLKRIVNE